MGIPIQPGARPTTLVVKGQTISVGPGGVGFSGTTITPPPNLPTNIVVVGGQGFSAIRSSDCCFKWRGHYCGTTGCCFRWHHDWRTCSCLWDSICSCWWTIDFRNWIYFGRRQRTDTHSRSRNNSNDHSDQWPNHHRRTKRPGNRWRYTDYAIQPNHASGHSRRHYILPSWRIYCRDWRQDVHFRTWGSTDHDCDQWPDDQYWTRRDRIQDDDIHGNDIETDRDCSRSDYE